MKYKVIYSLEKEIEDLKDGSNVHDINSLLNLYHIRVIVYNRTYCPDKMKEIKETEEIIRKYIKENGKG